MNDNRNMDIRLNEREKKVIASLIQFPGSSDVEIASLIGIKHSTFATIKKRLMKSGYFIKILLPNFAGFGAEIIGINVHNLPTSSKHQDDLNVVDIFNSLRANQNLLFSAIENEFAFTLSCYKDFSQLDDASWQFDNKARNLQLNCGFQHELNFPIHFSEFPRFLDYSRSIIRHLNVDLEEKGTQHVFVHNERPNLNITDLGMEILQCFLEAPGRTPKIVSQLLGKPRTTTTRWLRRFIEADLLTPRVIPNPEKLGYQVGLIMHFSIVSSKEPIFQKTLNKVDKFLTPIILMRSDFDIVSFSMFKSFESVQVAETEFFDSMTKEDITLKTEYRYLLSLPHTRRIIDFRNVFHSIFSNFGEIRTS
jgi:DNA-binding MarR family transcriptional regulator